jgi:plasmid stability protein
MKPYSNHLGDQMATNFTLKNIPDDLYEKVKERARRNNRSINGEIISMLAAATMSRPFDLDEILVRARELRGRTKGFLTEEFLRQAKREGLP